MKKVQNPQQEDKELVENRQIDLFLSQSRINGGLVDGLPIMEAATIFYCGDGIFI